MSETFTYEDLIAGTQKPVVTRPATARISESFSRGQIIGRLTATGKWQVIDITLIANCSDFGIAAEAVDTTDGVERNFSVYTEGEFDENKVLYSYSDTAADWRETLIASGIYLRKALQTTGQE
jgi:hypothetical protein